MARRIKYNWMFIIKDLDLFDKFEDFKGDSDLKRHLKGKKDISINRLARAFVLHAFKIMGFRLTPNYILGHEMPISEYLDMLRTSNI